MVLKALRGDQNFLYRKGEAASVTIITITGTPGSGKSTLAKLLAEKLGYKHYSIGDKRRKLAEERGITLAELNRRSETGEEDTDTPVDEYQRRLGLHEDDFVIDGRTGTIFIPHSLKLLLDANEEVRARRLLARDSVAENASSLAEAKQMNRERVESDRKRYIKYYGVDIWDKQRYDLVLDSTHHSPEELVAQVLARFPALRRASNDKRAKKYSTQK